MDATATPTRPGFSRYQKFVIAILAFLQFTIILDFMIVSPLGAMVMPRLHITPQQFGWVVSSYAFSAAVSGLLAAGFADRFDRKRLLLFFYAGFTVGTLLCGLAATYPMLLMARIVTGLFGGVIGSVVLAIATDLFPLEMRGRVMGFIQTAFAASQVLGLPTALYFANHWDWHAPFLAIIAVIVPVGLLIVFGMRPVNAHLALRQERSPFAHLAHTVTEKRYRLAFFLVMLLPTGGYMLMPFGTAFMVNNVGIAFSHLPTIYLVTGLFTVFVGPVVGRISDSFGKFNTFCLGSLVSFVMVAVWTNIGHTPLFEVIIINVVMFVGIFSRIIPSQALISAVPDVTKRGAFNAINASLQQFAGAISAAIAGWVIVEQPDGSLSHFNWLGYIVMAILLVSVGLMYFLHKAVPDRTMQAAGAAASPETAG
ncbi:MAG: MFS transporter [Alphaproteobacteria bacterium]|jgi:predicted MFS family arabinose efflux permease|nr:MFS transporter [Alphaproteobacteria bacterium]